MKLHIIVPTHNEADNLENCIDTLTKLYPTARITIAEDGSTDGTKAITHLLPQQYPNVYANTDARRLGKGKAIRQVLLRGYINAFYDADMAVNPYALKPMLEILAAKGGLVIAKRIALNRTWIRTVTSKLYNQLVNLLFKTNVSDHQCGCKLLSPEATETALTTHAKDFFFDTELIVKCQKANQPITEFTVTWIENKKKSTVNTTKDSYRMLIALLKLKKELGWR